MMRKTTRKLGILLLILGLISGCGKADMRNFEIVLPDGATKMSTIDIPNGKPIILVHLVEGCKFCKDEAVLLLKNIEQLKNVRIYLISTESFHEMKAFAKQYRPDRYDNVTLGMDITRVPYFHNVSRVPGTILYDGSKKLITAYDEFTALDTILRNIHSLTVIGTTNN